MHDSKLDGNSVHEQRKASIIFRKLVYFGSENVVFIVEQ
jgi:hypothetical protein